MNQVKRRATYQYGTLVLETRKRGPNVWVYRYFEFENGGKRRRKSIVGTQEEYTTRSEAERACEHLRLSANSEIKNQQCPTRRAVIDRYIDQVLRPCNRRSPGRHARQRCSAVRPLCQVLQITSREMGTSTVGELPDSGFQQAGDSCQHRGVVSFPVAFGSKPDRGCSENGAGDQQRHAAHVQVRCEVGLLEREPNGRKAGGVATGIDQAAEAFCAAHSGGILFPSASAGAPRETGCCVRRLAWAPYKRGFWTEMVRHRSSRGRGLVSTRLRSRSNHSTENRSLMYKSAFASRVAGSTAPLSCHHSLPRIGRLGLRLSIYEGPTSILARAVAKDANKANRLGRWLAEYWLAQFSAYRKRLWKGGRPRTGGREDAPPTRGHRNHLECVRRSRNGSQAADSAAARRICENAGAVAGKGAEATNDNGPVDPYLTQNREWIFWKCLKIWRALRDSNSRPSGS